MSYREVVVMKKQGKNWKLLFEFFPIEWRSVKKYDAYFINCDNTKNNLICVFYYEKDAVKD